MFSMSLDWPVREKHKDTTEAGSLTKLPLISPPRPSPAHGQLELKILC